MKEIKLTKEQEEKLNEALEGAPRGKFIEDTLAYVAGYLSKTNIPFTVVYEKIKEFFYED